jgi:chromosome segregation protein
VDESIHVLEKELGEQKAFLVENMRVIEAAKTRLSDLHDKIKKIGEERALLEKREEELKKELAQLEKRISTKNKDLVEKEKALKSRMEGLSRVQGQIEKIQIDLSSLQTEVRNLHENYRERYGRDLSDFSAEIYEIRENGRDLRDQLQTAREEQKKLGQVNLMAVEEFAEVKERYEFLQNQLEDLRKAKEDLKSITGQIRSESTELFLDTYEKIRKNFHVMFRRLFGGGRAELKLSDTDNVLESGIEIYVQPPGKKLENIALLSGGERSLTAVALLFATYMVKPSPFCILDEIDAALDEENVGRFVNLLREFGKTSQFVIITHNKKTVMGARTLLGVTMEESGISKIVAIRLDSEENEKGVNG